MAKICATCFESIDKPCVGGLSGRPMPVKHKAVSGFNVLEVSDDAARQMQAARRKQVADLAVALPRRSDNSQVAVPKRKGLEPDFKAEQRAARERDARRKPDCYTPNHQEVGRYSVKELIEAACRNPQILKRSD